MLRKHYLCENHHFNFDTCGVEPTLVDKSTALRLLFPLDPRALDLLI